MLPCGKTIESTEKSTVITAIDIGTAATTITNCISSRGTPYTDTGQNRLFLSAVNDCSLSTCATTSTSHPRDISPASAMLGYIPHSPICITTSITPINPAFRTTGGCGTDKRIYQLL